MSLRVQRAIRGAFVALVVSSACGRPLPTHLVDGDAGGDEGGDVADTGPDLQQPSDLRFEVDCPECNGWCGDGVLKVFEQCDDGNHTPADGCSGICQLNPGWTCPVPGLPCQRIPDQDAAVD